MKQLYFETQFEIWKSAIADTPILILRKAFDFS